MMAAGRFFDFGPCGAYAQNNKSASHQRDGAKMTGYGASKERRGIGIVALQVLAGSLQPIGADFVWRLRGIWGSVTLTHDPLQQRPAPQRG